MQTITPIMKTKDIDNNLNNTNNKSKKKLKTVDKILPINSFQSFLNQSIAKELAGWK